MVAIAPKIEAVCQPARARKDEYGFSLFPGDEHALVKSAMFEQGDFQRAGFPVDGIIGHRMNPQIIMLAGCIDYRFPDSNRHHQTPFAFTLFTKDKGMLSFLGMPGESYPASDIIVAEESWIETDARGLGPIN